MPDDDKIKQKKRLKWRSSIENALFRAKQIVNAEYALYTKHTGLTPRQHILLANIKKHHTDNMSGLSLKTNIDKSSLAVLAVKLRDKGYIEIKKNKNDKRNLVMNVTNEGEKAMQEYDVEALRVEKKIRSVMNKGEAKMLLKNLQNLIKTFSKQNKNDEF